MNETPDTSDPNAAPPAAGTTYETQTITSTASQQPEPEFVEPPPQSPAAVPPQEEPAVPPFVASSPASPEPETNTSTPAGTATSATAPGASGGDGTPTAAPDADTPPPAEVVPRLHPGVHVHINAIEQLALFWGGDTGNTIRNHLGRLRDLLSRL